MTSNPNIHADREALVGMAAFGTIAQMDGLHVDQVLA